MVELTRENFKEELQNYNGRVLVDFYAPWCAECSALFPIIDAVSQKLNSVKFCSFNCDIDREFVTELGIMSIPALFLYENGKLINKKIGMLEEEDLIRFIDS